MLFRSHCAPRGSSSEAESRNLPHRETVLTAVSNPVFITLSHSSVDRTDEEKLGHDTPAFLSIRHAAPYIGAAVPSDHMPVSIRNTSIGSGLPLNNGASKSGDPGNDTDSLFEESTRFAPHTAPSMSGV